MGRKIVDTYQMSHEEFKIFAECARNPFFFAQFIMLIHPIRGKVPFDLYPFQKAVLKSFIENRFNIVLKFRQAGITELISLFCLWFAMYHPYKNIVIISIKDRVAKKVLRKIKFMYKNLPPYLRTRIVNGRTDDSYGTATEMEFSNGSLISSIPTTEDAGRSEAVSLMVIDEAAIVRWAERIFAASWPTLSTGGRAILNSTAYGVGNLFHKLYTGAMSGSNDFIPIRLHWRMHPERDDAWYKQQFEILGPRKTAQEIDGDFLTSGNTVFDLSDIRDIEDEIENSIKIVKSELNGHFKQYVNAERGKRHWIGADISTGRANDSSTASCMDAAGDEKFSFKGKIPVGQMADFLCRKGKEFGNAVLAPESNDIGLAVATKIQDYGYPNLYYSKTLLRKKNTPKPEVQEIPGWYTTKKNRPVIIAGLEEDIRNDTVTIKDMEFCREAPTFIYDARNRPIAMNKDKEASDELFGDEPYTDDAIFGKAITNHIRKEKVSKTTLPR